jgi:hypothetical protein
MRNKPGPRCKACNHREHAGIDLALANGVAIAAVAQRYGLSVDTIYRHARNHIPAQLRAKLIAGPDLDIDLDKLRETESQSLLSNLIAIRRRLIGALDVAEEHSLPLVPRIASALHQNLEITARLVGSLGVGNTTINNVLVMPAYIETRIALVDALAPFPEAKQAVAQALHAIKSKAAVDVAADKRELA